jgi:acetyltransferase-like isoleucine patch superfamily enzyme
MPVSQSFSAALLYLQRLIPLAGVISNRCRFPGLRTGLRVEVSGQGKIIYGNGVRIGEGTRIDLAPGSRLVLGDGIVTGRGAYFALGPDQQQTIGDGTSIQDGCRINGDVTIGRGCIFAPNIFVSTGNHTFDALPYLPIRAQERVAPSRELAIRVLDDCWIGINAVLTPGVTIGRGCVVGSNAVVTTDLEPYTVAVGVPARAIRKRLDFVPPARIEAAREEDLPYFYDGFELVPEPRDELGCEGDFSLALRRTGAHVVRLCLSGDGSEIWHGDSRQTMPRTPGVIEFALDSNGNLSPFLRFYAQGRARVRWAELV